MKKTPEEIVLLVRNAGVIGAARSGFPTYVKLQAKAETVIVNGSECEPLLYTDKSILKNRPDEVIEGLILAMQAMGAREGVIALNESHPDVVAAVQNAIPANLKNIRIHLLGDYYPAGDEFLTVYDVCKKVIPEGGTPLMVGVAVFNVLTITQISQAVNGKPVTEKEVTIAGAVREPKVVRVPLGISYSELIQIAGGSTLQEFTVLDGGPMMGKPVSDLHEGIGKTTSGIVVLPTDHFAIRVKSRSVDTTACECARSTDVCPRNLLGHAIDPHLSLQAIHYAQVEPSAAITSAFLCNECGLCEVAGCDSTHASPKKLFGEYKHLLLKAGVQNPHHRSALTVHSQFENRKVSTPMLIKKLNITLYEKPLFLMNSRKEVSTVKIPLQKHQGAPALSVVKLGQLVRRGDVIAESPPHLLGSIYHASIHGKITGITDQCIEIAGTHS